MNKENNLISRRDFLQKSGAYLAGGCVALNQRKSLFDMFPEDSRQSKEVNTSWPNLEMNKLPTEISSILKSVPEMGIGDNGRLSFKQNGTWTEIINVPTQFNIEYSRTIDRLRTDVPWGIVLHWVGGEYENLENYVTRGFNSLRVTNGSLPHRTSAHVLVGDKSLLTSKSGLNKPVSIAQIQESDVDGIPFRAAHLSPINWKGYMKDRRWYPVNAMYELQYKCYPKFHSVLQDIYDGNQISVDKRTLGIEIVGSFFDKTPPAKQTTANVLATVWAFMKAYKIPAWDVLGHYEINQGKSDPGKEYISSIRFLLGIKALQDPDSEMKELVFGNFIEGNDYKKATRDYFDSIRKYLILTGRPDVVSRWESKTKFWFIYDSLFSEKNEMPIANSLRSPIGGKDIGTGYKFLSTRTDGGLHPGYDYNMENDAGKPAYLIGNAKCVYVGNDLGQGFGNTAIFRLRTPDGSDFLIRYLHLEGTYVNEGDIYPKGEIVGKIGKTGGHFSEHLHFDVAPISTYERIGSPDFEFNYYPSANVSRYRIKEQFVDPNLFISQYPKPTISALELRECFR